MLTSIFTGIGGIVSLMVLWIVIQSWWGKTFSEYLSDEDVLAGRTSCGNCGCTTICQKNGNEVV